MSEGESSDAGHDDDEKVTSNAALDRIYKQAIQTNQTNIKNLRDQYHKIFEELRQKSSQMESDSSGFRTRVKKLEQRYQQALEYNNSVSSENEDLNTELKKVKAQLAAAQATIKALKQQVAVSKAAAGKTKPKKVKKRVVKAESSGRKKARVKRERSSSSSSSRSRSRGKRNKRSRSRSRGRKRRNKSKSRGKSSSSGSRSRARGKGRKGSAPPPPLKRNPSQEKAFTFKPGSLGVKCKGVMVHEVTPGGQAESLGIHTGWNLVEVNDVTVNSANVRAELKKAILSKAPFTITYNTSE